MRKLHSGLKFVLLLSVSLHYVFVRDVFSVGFVSEAEVLFTKSAAKTERVTQQCDQFLAEINSFFVGLRSKLADGGFVAQIGAAGSEVKWQQKCGYFCRAYQEVLALLPEVFGWREAMYLFLVIDVWYGQGEMLTVDRLCACHLFERNVSADTDAAIRAYGGVFLASFRFALRQGTRANLLACVTQATSRRNALEKLVELWCGLLVTAANNVSKSMWELGHDPVAKKEGAVPLALARSMLLTLGDLFEVSANNLRCSVTFFRAALSIMFTEEGAVLPASDKLFFKQSGEALQAETRKFEALYDELANRLQLFNNSLGLSATIFQRENLKCDDSSSDKSIGYNEEPVAQTIIPKVAAKISTDEVVEQPVWFKEAGCSIM